MASGNKKQKEPLIRTATEKQKNTTNTKESMEEEEDNIIIKIGEWEEMIKTIRDVFLNIKGLVGRLHLIS
jgi:hypothetical protein